MIDMTDPSNRIPEPSFPEHNLLRAAGPMPVLTAGLRDRVLRNCHQQVRYGRWADRFRIVASVAVACLLVGLVWHFRSTGPRSQDVSHDAVPTQQTAEQDTPAYVSPALTPEDEDSKAKLLPQGGPSLRRDISPETHDLNQLIEKFQGRSNALCGFLPY